MKPGIPGSKVRCRLIADEDLAAVAALLDRGFPGHRRDHWSSGLARMSRRPVPENLPRYGYCLETEARIVGVLLLISATRRIADLDFPFINVASWYVEPDYRAYAQLLVSMALRNRAVTFTNVTPAPHTWPIVEAQGYERYCDGLFFAAAALKRPARGVSIMAFDTVAHDPAVQALPEYAMLERHHELGCRVLVVGEDGRLSGCVFRRYRIRSGRLALPAMLVIHAPDRPQLVRIAGNLGRWFLREAAPVLVMDANGPVAGLPGVYTARRGRKYYRGPQAPALCDLADTELVIFGVQT